MKDSEDAKTQEIIELRTLLAMRVAGTGLYADDGELSDATTQPWIDFLRDSPFEIARKLNERANLRAQLSEREKS